MDDAELIDTSPEDSGWTDITGDEGASMLPPGEEGFLHSHAGGEAMVNEILATMIPR